MNDQIILDLLAHFGGWETPVTMTNEEVQKEILKFLKGYIPKESKSTPLKQDISKIFIKYGLPTVQVVINEIVSLIEDEHKIILDKSFDAGYRSASLKDFTPEQIKVLKMYYNHVVSFVKQKRKSDNIDKIVIEIKSKLDSLI